MLLHRKRRTTSHETTELNEEDLRGKDEDEDAHEDPVVEEVGKWIQLII